MAGMINIEKCKINTENNVLDLEISGELPYAVHSGRFRLAALFCGEHEDRHFPMIAYGTVLESNRTKFHSFAFIQLNHVFYHYQATYGEKVALKFRICSPDKEWLTFDTDIIWDAEQFQTEFLLPPPSAFTRFWRKLEYVCCTILLPVWMLQGYLAMHGHGKLHPLAQGRSGVKAALYHAHGQVSDWTGYGYSIRELKTNYFREQYEKFCSYYPETEGILFLSERRVEQGGNLSLIRDALHELSNRTSEDISPEWENSEFGTLREFLVERPVSKLKWKELRRCAEYLACSRVIVLEDFYPQLHALSIRQETSILQMWHACGAFKLFGLSDLGVAKHLEQSSENHRNYDAALASSAGIVPFYSEAYGMPEERIYPIGVPRTDVFFDANAAERIREKMYQKYPICRDHQVVLFAPTFRGSGKQTAYYPLDRFPVDQVMDAMPEDTVLILKNHPFMKEAFPVGAKYQPRVLDLSTAEHINDILFITDILVTDYSSSIFEAALLDIPMLFYVFDLEEYLKERDLYFDFTSFVPGMVVQELPDLLQGIGTYLAEGNSEECDQDFRRFFLGALDGHSTERTLQLIRQMYLQNDVNYFVESTDGGDTVFQKWDKELDLLEKGKSKYVWDELEELITDDFEEEKLTEEEFDKLMHRLMGMDSFI